MVSVNLKSLVSKLNDPCRRTLEGAAGLCLSRTNYNVEIEHWLIKLLEESGTDLAPILKAFGIDHSRLVADLTRALDRLKTGNSRPPALSPDLVSLAREAWVLASIEFSAPLTRTGYVLAALLSDESLGRIARASSAEFEKITPASLITELPSLIANSSESVGVEAPVGSGPESGQPVKPGGPSKTPSLDQYTIDLTARARAGEIDPVLGRDDEIRQVIDILTRRRQNNPIITGEAGVGKTAAVEGFALRIAAGDVPVALKNVSLRTLDLALLQAGAGVKGEFENRLKSVIQEVKKSLQPIILFIDEAHTMIGAGGSAGQGDAANLLKPALARGELRTIAATTWAEYKKYFEKDAALARRFQVVKVEEPTESVCVEMIRGLLHTLEAHHNVRILDEGAVEAVRLSNRYISGRQLPDKAVSLIDTACARVALGQQSTPPAVEDLQRRIDQIGVAIETLDREAVTGSDHSEKLGELNEEKAAAESNLAALTEQWHQETDLVQRIREIRNQLEGKPIEATDGDAKKAATKPGEAVAETAVKEVVPLTEEQRSALLESLSNLNGELDGIQGENPLMQVCVDSQAIADVVSNWTGIPVGRMVSDEIRTVLNLKDKMEERVVGQSHGLETIAQSVRTSRAKLKDPKRPIGVFMLAGPSGVGKTETAITLAELLYGGEQNMTVINMSEFKEEHKVSLLLGSPPGYVGFGEGGVLTEAVRRRPYSVVLLDELEKAHEGVQEIFYQVFDKGTLRDGEGRDIDFKNTVIIMTSNAGTDLIMKLCADPELMPDPETLGKSLHQELLNTFKPAFLGRCTIIPYFPLGDDVMRNIIKLKLGHIVRRVRENYRSPLEYSEEVIDAILSRCQEVSSGARNIDNIVNGTLLPELSGEFLSRMADGASVTKATIKVAEDGNFAYSVE
ncbi:MAG: type VI secretion system ATPase TssH [Planctomycetota bacterium]|nr:type VI secretion system ATPase TssH [Planctomycetota bacterium]